MAVDKDGNEIKEPTEEEKAAQLKASEDAKLAAEGPKPAISADQLKGVVAEGMTEALQSFLANDTSGGPAATIPQATDNTLKPTEDPLKAAIDPIIKPGLDRANLESAGARDAATFYPSHPEAVEYRDEIEKGFDSLQAAGTPFKRQAVWEWLKGSPKYFDKFVQKQIAVDKQKTTDAENLVTVDGSSRPVTPALKVVDENTPDDQLNKALENQSF